MYPYPPKEKQEFCEQDYIKSGSASDCTGLIPSAPLDDAEFDSYNEVYNFLPPPPDEEKADE